MPESNLYAPKAASSLNKAFLRREREPSWGKLFLGYDFSGPLFLFKVLLKKKKIQSFYFSLEPSQFKISLQPDPSKKQASPVADEENQRNMLS